MTAAAVRTVSTAHGATNSPLATTVANAPSPRPSLVGNGPGDIPLPGQTSPPDSPAMLSPSSLPTHTATPEVSMVETSEFTGVTFSPELWMQRRTWALDVLRKEKVRSVMDIGCGPGSLLQTLVVPPATIAEPPILAEDGSAPDGREIFVQRIAGVDMNPDVMPSAIKIMEPPNPQGMLAVPRWQPMEAELWLGGIERYNRRLEGYEAIVAIELIEHLEPNLLSRFGVVTMGTFRPRLLLVTTPNFDFNSKFPHGSHQHDHDHESRGFVDPTGRTGRVFRHSDHKCEMTANEFYNWATAAAADWGYDVEISGVGVSSNPSFYPLREGESKPRPVYATNTAVFRLASGVPMRSPRSVRTVDLPFMRGASEANNPHRLAGKWSHAPTIQRADGAPFSPTEILKRVAHIFEASQPGPDETVSVSELWYHDDISTACAGSKRWLVGSLGGWGNCPAVPGAPVGDFEVVRGKNGLAVKRRCNQQQPEQQ